MVEIPSLTTNERADLLRQFNVRLLWRLWFDLVLPTSNLYGILWKKFPNEEFSEHFLRGGVTQDYFTRLFRNLAREFALKTAQEKDLLPPNATPPVLAAHLDQLFFGSVYGSEGEITSQLAQESRTMWRKCTFWETEKALEMQKSSGPGINCDAVCDAIAEGTIRAIGAALTFERPRCMLHGDPVCEKIWRMQD